MILLNLRIISLSWPFENFLKETTIHSNLVNFHFQSLKLQGIPLGRHFMHH